MATWTDTTDRRLHPYALPNRWEVTAGGATYRVERATYAYHLLNADGDWLGVYPTRGEAEAAITTRAAAGPDS